MKNTLRIQVISNKLFINFIQNTVYQLLSETFSTEYQFGFRYTRDSPFEGEGTIRFGHRTYDRTCGCYDGETGVFTAQAKGVYGQDSQFPFIGI